MGIKHSDRVRSREDSTYSELLGIMYSLTLYNLHCNLLFGGVSLIGLEAEAP